ncbi:MAG: DUF992 domain-containing protein [Magnetococcales bacterium]|nr:DUF992 domain-containing protein [Magnetococcales bacterium]
MKKNGGWTIALMVLGLISPVMGGADGYAGVELGVLSCKKIPGGYNFVLHSSEPLECEFSTVSGGEFYRGEAGVALGLKLEWNPSGTIVFTVIGASNDVRPGAFALEGKYFGAKASAAVGLGTGIQVLVGGGQKSFTLQPLAVEGSTGLGATAGLGYLHLQPWR